MSNWIDRRFEVYSDRIRQERALAQAKGNAAVMAGSMFDSLKSQIRDAVKQYNQLFTSDPTCKAHLGDSNDAIRIDVGKRAVSVLRNQGSTVISFQYADQSGKVTDESIEVAPDEELEVKYKHSGKFYDAEEAAELILDKVFCK